METKVVRDYRGGITIIIGGKAYGFISQQLPDVLSPGSRVLDVLAGVIDADSLLVAYDETDGDKFSVEELSKGEDLTGYARSLMAGFGLEIIDVEPEEPKP